MGWLVTFRVLLSFWCCTAAVYASSPCNPLHGSWVRQPLKQPINFTELGYGCPDAPATNRYRRKRVMTFPPKTEAWFCLDPENIASALTAFETRFVPDDTECVLPTPPFVEALGDREVVFYGDSLTEQHVWDFCCFLWPHITAFQFVAHKRRVHATLRTQGTLRSVYSASLHFTANCKETSTVNTTIAHAFWEEPFETASVVIVNSGAWWQRYFNTCYDWLVQQVTALVTALVQYLATQFRGYWLVRSQNHGHYNCSQYSGSGARNVPSVLRNASASDNPYGLWFTGLVNGIWRAALAHYDGTDSWVHVSALDVRPDGHIFFGKRLPGPRRALERDLRSEDCLHYCMPGPIRLWTLATIAALGPFLLQPHANNSNGFRTPLRSAAPQDQRRGVGSQAIHPPPP